MRNLKYVFPIIVIAVVLVALMATLGLTSGDTAFFVTTVWLAALLSLGFFAFLVLGYMRIVGRLRTANEGLAEVRFLLERRYDQLRRRLDYLTDYVRVLHRNIQNEPLREERTQRSPEISKVLAEVEYLTARIQRFERRTLGKLENEQWAMNRQNMQLDKIKNDSREM